ncbi:hypothetical protein L1987_54471 [Smallanthus sonchifolius]|uniref:Uncharacterized protein n=1 Tax=Smallanthus sonchifolius TaxID=185202 RepID=A0ACB9E7X3_9ASTR|nr:hypothetical protein L1987_54471 [Smallanthus sonchifolius]
MALAPIDDEDDTRSESSLKLASENGEIGKSLPYPSTNYPNSFAFKIQDKRGRMHRFIRVEKVINNEGGNSMMQKFWDSAMALAPIDDEDDTRSESSLKLAYENGETEKSLLYPSTNYPNSFAFKIQDKRGRMHRFIRVEKVINNEGGNSVMQKFWDSAMALAPIDDEDDTRSESSLKLASENGETGKSLPYPSTNYPNSFALIVQDKRGRMHRFIRV